MPSIVPRQTAVVEGLGCRSHARANSTGRTLTGQLSRALSREKAVDVETELFLALAEISGVFVGFGALISVRSPGQTDLHSVIYLRAVLAIGLWVLIAALLPVAVSRYGVNDRTLWLSCALAVLALYAAVVAAVNLTPEGKALNRSQYDAVDRVFPVVGLPLHLIAVGSLALIVVGEFPHLDESLYLTALITAQIFAGYTLLMLALSQKYTPDPDGRGESG